MDGLKSWYMISDVVHCRRVEPGRDFVRDVLPGDAVRRQKVRPAALLCGGVVDLDC